MTTPLRSARSGTGMVDAMGAETSDLDRPLTARSVILSTLLGTDPPRLPPRRLVRAAALFDIRPGTARTALSRLVAAGELVIDDGWYALAGEHRQRQARQLTGIAGNRLEWGGRWRLAVVADGVRTAQDRARLRRELSAARFGSRRDGVWMRPDNLPRPLTPTADRQCDWFDAAPFGRDDELAAELWDLDSWATTAHRLRRSLHESRTALAAADAPAMRRGFQTSAAVLRHFNADPLLPVELLGRSWPGDLLRRDFAAFDAEYRRRLLEWLSGDDSDGR